MTDNRAISSPVNGRRGGRPIEPLQCTCGRTDGTHGYKCRVTVTMHKRKQRAKNKLDKG